MTPQNVKKYLISRQPKRIIHELQDLQRFEWYKSLKEMRNKAIHNPAMIGTLYVGGGQSGEISLPENPFVADSVSTLEVSRYLHKILEHAIYFIDKIQIVILEEVERG